MKSERIGKVLAGWLILFTVLGLTACTKTTSGIPEQIGKWRIEIGPEGNEVFLGAGKKEEQEIVIGAPEPSEAVLRWVEIFTPDADVDKWEYDAEDSEFKIYVEDPQTSGEYKFYVKETGRLEELTYEKDQTGVEEKADEMTLPFKRREIRIDEAPKAMLEALAKAYPDSKPSKAWSAKTVVGPRFIVQLDNRAFYATPQGQIRCADEVKDALAYYVPPEQTMTYAKKFLGGYGDLFHFKKLIEKKLGKDPENPDGSYRYIVMGDSKGNYETWRAIMKHIDLIDPKPDFIINTGDAVETGFAHEYMDYYLSVVEDIDIPIFIAIGNHDDGDDSMAREFRLLFGKDALNYYFDYGNSRYLFMDNVSDVRPYSETLAWLDSVLTDTPLGYRKYVSCHKPPATIQKWAHHAWEDEESKVFTELMTKHKVDHVCLSHIHAYTTEQFNGVDYTVSGGGGASLTGRFGPQGKVYHYVICDVTQEEVTRRVVRFYDTTAERAAAAAR